MTEDLGNILLYTVYALFVGVVGTGMGGLGLLFDIRGSGRTLSFILECSGGLMLSIVCFDLLPSAFDIAQPWQVLAAFACGVGAMLFLEECFKKEAAHRHKKKASGHNDSLLRMALGMAMGIALHNLPEGLAIGTGFESSARLGLSLSVAILIHNIPEGMALAVPAYAGGWPKHKALLLAAAAGLPLGLGGFIGAMLGQISGRFIAWCLGIAGGAMMYVVLADIFPESKRGYAGRFPVMGGLAGFSFGIIISILCR